MSDYIGVVTNAGQAKIAAAIGGTALNLTTIRVGDGNGAPIVPNPAMTDLVRRVGAAYPIVSSGRDPVNANHWRVTALIPVGDGPFDVREIGVWDAAGEMIAVAKHVLVEKRTPAQGAAVELLTDIVFPVSETAQVTVQVTPAAQISIFQMLRAGFTVVESATVTAPPGAPALGRTHVVPAGATGAWNGLAGMLVQWNGIVWVAVDAPIGFHVVDQSKGIDTGARWLERTAAGWTPGVSRLIQKQPGNWTVISGTATAITSTMDPAPTSWADLVGVPIRGIMPNAATGASTLAIDGLPGTKPVVASGAAIIAGQWSQGQIVEMFYDGANVQVSAMRRGTLLNVIYFTAAGTSVYAPTPGTREVDVEVQGAGGGGSGCPATDASNTAIGSGGGAGAYARKRITTGFSGVTVTVGAGGSTGAGVVGGAGGASSFGALVSANGGGGGQYGYSSAQTFYAPGGSGGSAGSSGDINFPGAANAGALVAVLQGITFPRATGMFGGGAGSGGSGSTNSYSQAAKPGEAGRAGIVVVREYA